MTVLLGVRVALAAGRENLARLTLTAVGVAVGVTLLLLSLSALPALDGRTHRQAWHGTTTSSPPSAPGAALWIGVHDGHAGDDLFRGYVTALGTNPPTPPGLDRLPHPGEVAVSPALRRRLESTPDDQLRDRLPGTVTATIGPGGLASPDELVAVIGRTPEQIRAMGGREIRGFETRSEGFDPSGPRAFLVTIGAVALLLPLVIFIGMVTRIAAARREQRLAAMRLVGATRLQTAVIAAAETGIAAVAGTVLGWLGYLVGRGIVADTVTISGARFVPADVAVPSDQLVAVLVGVPLLAMAATVASLTRVQVTPLGISRLARKAPPGPARAVPLVAGIGGFLLVAALRSTDTIPADGQLVRLLTAGSLVSTLVGLVYSGPAVCVAVARMLAAVSRRAPTLIAARRIAGDPYTTFRAVSGVVLAVFVTTAFSSVASNASDRGSRPDAFALRPGVVEVYVGGMSADRLRPLIDDGAIVARQRPGDTLVIYCADLARAINLACPPARRIGDNAPRGLSGMTRLAEPEADSASLPVRALYLLTDGTPAAQERVRTRATAVVPQASISTGHDRAVVEGRQVSEVDYALRLATLFILVVGAFSLTVSVVSGLIERRRPFALLRACGVRVSELRQIVVLETAVPMLLTVLTGFGAGLATSYALGLTSSAPWSPPGAGFLASLGIGVVAALAVTLAALPLMSVAIRHNTVRYE